MATNTNFEKEIIPTMQDKLKKIEEDVQIEKNRVQDCRSAIRKSINSLCELLDGEEISEETQVESLGGTDVKPE